MKKNITIDQLLEEVKWFVKEENCEAIEILEVVNSFSNFKRWADHMTEQASHYIQSQSYINQLVKASAEGSMEACRGDNSDSAEAKTSESACRETRGSK